MRLLVVGLTPSRRYGKSPTVKNLKKWLETLEVQYSSFSNLYLYPGDKLSLASIISVSSDYSKIIALGNKVSEVLTLAGINHFKMPHPSGLNRKLNDPKYVHEQLQACKNYLYRG